MNVNREMILAPLSSLRWVKRDMLRANDYNPNKVSEENLKLLVQSILTNGWTLPIVVRPDYTIIDGFHRWTVSGREPLLSLLGGTVPLLLLMIQKWQACVLLMAVCLVNALPRLLRRPSLDGSLAESGMQPLGRIAVFAGAAAVTGAATLLAVHLIRKHHKGGCA